jgi:hypothetical protein
VKVCSNEKRTSLSHHVKGFLKQATEFFEL